MAAQVALEDLAARPPPSAALCWRLDVARGCAPWRATSCTQLEPVLARRLVGGGDDLHRVAVLQLVAQRHELAVHPRAGAVVPDLGVDAVGEVDHRRARREVQHVALRREDEDLVAEEVHLHRARGTPAGPDRCCCHSSSWRSQAKRWRCPGAAAGRRRLVPPVRGDAVLGDAVHLAGADLDLDALAVRADHRRVQRLVHVRLRQRDVVLEAPGHRLPVRVHDAERLVALAHARRR